MDLIRDPMFVKILLDILDTSIGPRLGMRRIVLDEPRAELSHLTSGLLGLRDHIIKNSFVNHYLLLFRLGFRFNPI
jgi:hypothetical protein